MRHRIQEVDGALKNTSWALVTMAKTGPANRAFRAAAAGELCAGRNVLRVEMMSEQKVATSTGQMSQIRTNHWLQLQAQQISRKEIFTNQMSKQKTSACVVCWSWFWWLMTVFGLGMVVLFSWADVTVLYPLSQSLVSIRLPALNVTLTTREGVRANIVCELSSQNAIATESNGENGIIDNSRFTSTVAGGPLLLAEKYFSALQFRDSRLPPGAQIHDAVILFEAVGQDNRILAQSPSPLHSTIFGEAEGASFARQSALEVRMFAEAIHDARDLRSDTHTLSFRVRDDFSRTRQQIPWAVKVRNGFVPQLAESANISAVLQELVNLPYWGHSSPITLFVEHVSGRGQVMFTNDNDIGSVFTPVLMTVWWAAIYVIQRRFNTTKAKMLILDVVDTKEQKIHDQLVKIVVVVNCTVMVGIVWFVITSTTSGTVNTGLWWLVRIFVGILAAYSMNLLTMWGSYFFVACEHLLCVVENFWFSMSLQTNRAISALIRKYPSVRQSSMGTNPIDCVYARVQAQRTTAAKPTPSGN
eukprot:COSAG01_NODE_1903_length_8958_cov_6.750536_3_plen_529_part_00